MIRSKRKKSTNVADKRIKTPDSSLAGPSGSKPNTKSSENGDLKQAARSPERTQSPMRNGEHDGRQLDFNDLEGTGPGVPPPPYPGKSGVSLSPSSVASMIRRRLNIGWSKEAKHSHRANQVSQSPGHGQSLTPLPEDWCNETQEEQMGDCNSRLGRHISRARERIKRSRGLMRTSSASSLAQVEGEQNIDQSEELMYIHPSRNYGTGENHNRPIQRARSLASLSEEGYLHEQRGNRAEATYNQNGEQQGICNSPVVHRLSRSRERVIEHSRRLMRARSASSLAESDDEQNIDKSEDGIYLNTRRSRSTDVNQNGPIHRAQSLMSLSEADCSHKEQLGESSPRVTRHISRSRERIQHNRTLMRSRSSSSLAASDDEQNNNMENKEESNLHVRNNQRTDVNQNRWNISEVEEEHAKAAQRYKEEINKLKAQLTETQDENRSLQTLTNKMKREDGLLQKTKEELQKVLTEKKQLQQAHARFELELTQYRKNAELQNNARNSDNSHKELGHLSEMIVSDELMKCKEDPETESQETGRGTLDYTNALESKLREANRLLKGANEQVEKLDEERRNLLLECKMQSQLLQQSEDKLRQLQDENSGLKEEVKKAASVPATGGLVIQDMKTKDVAMEELRSLHEMQDKAFTSELETDKLRRIVQELKDSHIKMRSENLSLQSKCEKQTKEIAGVLKTYKEKEQIWKKEIEQLRLQVAEQAPSGEKYDKIIAENMDKKREQSKTKIQQKEMEANMESINLDLHQQIGEKDRAIVKTTEELTEKTKEE
ncbi:putative leucine-rich repeat-containing protein DDB_G0290503, partial [Branchiostoma lanceolatum]|uniref:putative leucine-rich repeat-containing protein DDB_G0290503 n=1 Tax=Branchiostoma lanceolatum TaxID=7740 RepID=UPI0034520343